MTSAILTAARNGGTPASGGITVVAADVIQLGAVSTIGWVLTPAPVWRLFDYPVGFTLPAGWTADGDGSYFYQGVTPPTFVIPTVATFGKWGCSLTVAQITPSDENTYLDLPSANGLHGVGFKEVSQFGKGWTTHLNATIRATDTQLGGAETSGIVFAATVADPGLRQTQKSGTGATVGINMTLQAEKGQQQTGGNANNAGGNLFLAGGDPGTGGSGAAGERGHVNLYASDLKVVGALVNNADATKGILKAGLAKIEIQRSDTTPIVSDDGSTLDIGGTATGSVLITGAGNTASVDGSGFHAPQIDGSVTKQNDSATLTSTTLADIPELTLTKTFLGGDVDLECHITGTSLTYTIISFDADGSAVPKAHGIINPTGTYANCSLRARVSGLSGSKTVKVRYINIAALNFSIAPSTALECATFTATEIVGTA